MNGDRKLCPFNDEGPEVQDLQVEPDQPCPVCGDYGDHRSPILSGTPSKCVYQDPPINRYREVGLLPNSEPW